MSRSPAVQSETPMNDKFLRPTAGTLAHGGRYVGFMVICTRPVGVAYLVNASRLERLVSRLRATERSFRETYLDKAVNQIAVPPNFRSN